MKKRTGIKLISYLLTAAMVVGGLSLSPLGTVEVQAAATVKNVNLKLADNSIAGIDNPTSGADDSATEWAGTTVYYGDKAYYVLDKDGTSNGHSSVTGNMLLLSKGVIDGWNQVFYNSGLITVGWTGSNCTIRDVLNGDKFYGNSEVFTAIEQEAISLTTINDGNTSDYFDYNDGVTRPYNMKDSTDDKIFLLDIDDVLNPNYGFSSQFSGSGTRVADPNCSLFWWLRSLGFDSQYATSVSDNGIINVSGNVVIDNRASVRPAFNLNLSSVLFSSASKAGKSSFAVVDDSEVSNNTWKLTIKDTDTEADFDVTLPTTATRGKPISVLVNTAEGGTVSYNQISAMLVDENKTVMAYGKIGEYDTGDKRFIIPSTILEGDYTLMVFPEQVNEGNLTDYAGMVVSQPITIMPWDSTGTTVKVVLQKDGIQNSDIHTVSLFKAGEEQYQLTRGSDGTYSEWVVKGEYDIYADGNDTGYDIITDEYKGGVVLNYYTVLLTAGDGIESVSGNGAYLKGTNVPIHAEVEEGYSFSEWKKTFLDTEVSTENEYVIRNIECPHVYTAVGKEVVSPIQDVKMKMTVYSGKYKKLSEVKLSGNHLTGESVSGNSPSVSGNSLSENDLLAALEDYEWEDGAIDLSGYTDCSKTFYLSKKNSEGTQQDNKSYPDIPITIHFTSLAEIENDVKEGKTVLKGDVLPLKVTSVFTQGALTDTLTLSASETAKTKLGLKFSQSVKPPVIDSNTGEYIMYVDTTDAKPGTTKVTIKATITEGVSPKKITKTVSTTANLTVIDKVVGLTYDKYYAAGENWNAAQKETSGNFRNLNVGDGAQIKNIKVNNITATTVNLLSTDETVLKPIQPTTGTSVSSVKMEAKKAGTVLVTVTATTANKKTAKDTFRVTVTEQGGMITTITTDKDVINKAKKAQYEQVTCTVKTNNVSVNAANISINEVEKLSGDKKSYKGSDIPFEIQSISGNTFSLMIKNNAKNLEELSGKCRIKYAYTGVQEAADEYLEPIEITVTKETPTVTIKQTKKVNLFHVGLSENKIQKVGDESKGRIQVVPKNASQYNVAFTGGDFTIPVITDQTGSSSTEPQGLGISSADVSISANVVTQEKKVKQLSKKVNYTITFPEYRGEGNGDYQQTGSFTIATATTKPKFSAVMKNPVLYTRFGMEKTELSILLDGTEVPETSLSINEVPSNQSIPDGKYLLADNKTNIGLLVTGVDPNKVLWIKNTEDEAGRKTTTATLTLKKSTWTSPLTTKVKLIVDNNPPIAKLTKSTLNLNNRYASYEQASTDIRLQNAEGFKVTRMKITPMDQKTAAISNKINVSYQSGTQTISAEFKNGVANGEVKKGTFNYILIPYYTAKIDGVWKTSAGQAFKLKTVVNDKDITLAVTGKGAIDLPIRKTTGITYTPKVQNITGTIKKVELTGVNRDLFELTNANPTVTGKTNPAGTVYVQAKAGSNLRTGAKYPIYLKYTLQTANGRITKSSKVLTITPKQTAAKVNWTSTGKTNYTTKLSDWSVSGGSAPNEATIEKQLTFTIQKPVGATIDKIVAQDPSGLFEFAYSSDGENPGAAIKGETDGYIRVTAKDITKVNLKKTYKVKFKIYLEDSAVNAKPLTTTVKIKVTK